MISSLAMAKTIGVLTGGGDCPGLNAVIRAVVRHATGAYGWEVVGFEDGFQGIYEKRYRFLRGEDVRGILTRGGTILGSSNKSNPFAYPLKLPDGSTAVRDVSADMTRTLRELDLAALVVIGGDGSMLFAAGLHEKGGVPIVGVPKTIDNDLAATDVTFGFHTAAQTAADALDRLHTTAESHDRIMLCEVMGRDAGWIALYAGLAAGADVILIPEIPYDIERIVTCVRHRMVRGITYSLVVVSEGARPAGGAMSVVEPGGVTHMARLGGAAERLATEIKKRVELEVRTTVLGHVQRGGTPVAFDRVLGTRLGVAAVDAVAREQFGTMVSVRGLEIVPVPIKQVAGQQRLCDPQSELVRTARMTGVELGG
jgi:6-phosphofructokinase 1